MAHSQLVEQARQHLLAIGATDIEVWDLKGRKHRAPVPDLVAKIGGRAVAVECGWMAGGRENRIRQLKNAGYEIVLEFPYLECFDSSMLIPQYGPTPLEMAERIRAIIKSMGESDA